MGKILWCVIRQDLFAPALAQAGLAPAWWLRLRVPLSVGLAAETLAAGLLG